MAELLVVVGVIALLIAIILPPLQMARLQAQDTQCKAQLRMLGDGLTEIRSQYKFYPYWDDNGSPIRYTWVDVLVQNKLIGDQVTGNSTTAKAGGIVSVAYCPSDLLPDPLNAARYPDLIYPLTRTSGGIDYSYGIGVPLSAGGWAWTGSGPSHLFKGNDESPSNRVLAGDAVASTIWNLSGNALTSSIWNDPTQFDNNVAWMRHRNAKTSAGQANLLFQDGHVSSVRYDPYKDMPVNTATVFVWQRGESIYSNPNTESALEPGFYYPYLTPPSYQSNPQGEVMPNACIPLWYTVNKSWTQVTHKSL